MAGSDEGSISGMVDTAAMMREILRAETPYLSEEAEENTPERFIDAFRELMGRHDKPWKFTTFESDCDEMVIVKDIAFVTLCEHHLLPIVGNAHVAYIPQGRIAGLSKLARTVQGYSRGLHTQEVLTSDIARFLMEQLEPLGVGVIMQADHACMAIRGVKSTSSLTITSAMLGVFRDNDNNARAEFLSLVNA
jgi:GTP cyclohydrolase I